MSPRSTSWIAIAALFAAAAALALAVVATIRASDDEPAMAAGSTMEDMGHGAAAPTEGVPDATATRGGEVLEPRVESGVWVYELQTKPVRWEILPGTRVTAYTYNGTVPGPKIRVPYGQRVRILVKNDLPDPTTVHWHGIAVPNAMDGVPGVTQDP